MKQRVFKAIDQVIAFYLPNADISQIKDQIFSSHVYLESIKQNPYNGIVSEDLKKKRGFINLSH